MKENLYSKRNIHASWWKCKPVQLLWMKITLALPQKCRNQSTSRYTYATVGHVPKRCLFLLWRHLINHIHVCSIYTSQKLEKKPRFPSMDEWIKKMWRVYMMNHGHFLFIALFSSTDRGHQQCL